MSVSIIIPCYNNAYCIKNAISSCYNLGLSSAEIIVVNDGSTDNIEEVLRDVAHITLINLPENRGPGAARNIGVENGKYNNLMFLDSDDVFLPEAASLVNELEEYDVVYGNFIYNGEEKKLENEYNLNLQKVKLSNPFTSVFACTKNVWECVKGYPEDREIYEDWAFLAKAYGKKFKFKYLNKFIFVYNRIETGRWNTMKQRRKYHFRKTLTYINEFLK